MRSEVNYSSVAKWAFFIAMLFVFSINVQYRFSMAGLLVHPYLLVLPLAIVLANISLLNIPKSTSTPLFFFLLFFTLGSLQSSNPLPELAKVYASFLTFLFFIHCVKSESDFRLVSWGFLAVAVVIGIMGFIVGGSIGEEEGDRLSGINVLEGIGNKNAQSLFTLPGLFLSLILMRHYIAVGKYFVVALLVGAIFFITVEIFLSANRSGWVGLVVVFVSFLIYWGFSTKTLVFGCILVFFAYAAIEYYASDVFERKKTQTIEGYKSDVGRKMLAQQSLLLGLENPILGLGFDRLHTELARRLDLNRFGIYKIDSHFLYGYLIGTAGAFTLYFFIHFLFTLRTRLLPKRLNVLELKKARILITCFVILFMIRALFSREILYSPTFIGALGLLFSYYRFKAHDYAYKVKINAAKINASDAPAHLKA